MSTGRYRLLVRSVFDATFSFGLLTWLAQTASLEMIQLLRELRKKLVIGFVGGSDLRKISEQLSVDGSNGRCILSESASIIFLLLGTVIDDFDYAFAENGLTAYRMGSILESQSFITFLGEERYKVLANFILHYIADMDIPIKRFWTIFYSVLILY